MIEQVFKLTTEDKKTIEKVLFDENLHYVHFIFNKGEGAPVHLSNGNVYMTVVRGVLSIALGEEEAHSYQRGTLLKIPKGVMMDFKNLGEEVLELIVVKAPAPQA